MSPSSRKVPPSFRFLLDAAAAFNTSSCFFAVEEPALAAASAEARRSSSSLAQSAGVRICRREKSQLRHGEARDMHCSPL